jgi:hypothetical protein
MVWLFSATMGIFYLYVFTWANKSIGIDLLSMLYSYRLTSELAMIGQLR